MALAIEDGVLWDNDDPWVDYYVLNTEETQVYRLFMNADNDVDIEESNEPEDNPQIEDSVDGTMYYVAITDLNIWLDTGAIDCTMNDLCAKLDEIRQTIAELQVSEEEQTETIITLNNGWKAIT